MNCMIGVFQIALPCIRKKSEAMLICKTHAMGPVAPIHIGTDAIEWVNKYRSLGNNS